MKKLVCLAMAMLVAPAAMVAQSAPPVKVGLWQSTSTVTMSGMQIPPDVAAKLQAMGRQIPGAQPRTTVMQSCLTAEKWQKTFSDMQQQRPNQQCTLSNQQTSSSGMSADISCKSADSGATSTGHMEVTFVSQEKATGKAHIETTMQQQPKPIEMNMTFESVFQGSDCKGISPDSPKVVK